MSESTFLALVTLASEDPVRTDSAEYAITVARRIFSTVPPRNVPLMWAPPSSMTSA